MDTGTAVVGTGLVVALGHWTQEKQIDIKVFVGIGVYAVSLAFIQQGSPELAGKFALLVLLAALFYYAVPIARKMGFTR
jgi:hypothetical protein